MDRRNELKPDKYFTELEKHQIIKELISTQITKRDIGEKYTGEVFVQSSQITHTFTPNLIL